MKGFTDSVLVLVGLYGVLLGTIALHEAGHLLAGFAVGLQLVTIRVGPLELNRVSKRKVAWLWKSMATGLTRMRSRNLNQRLLVLRYVCFVVGGPLANLLAAVAAYFIAQNKHGGLAEVCGAFMVLNVLISVGTLIPASTKGLDTDGRVLSYLIFNKQRREVLIAKMTFVERLKQFRTSFEAASMADAAEQLSWMEKACHGRNGDKLRLIVLHLREHFESGASLEECGWSMALESKQPADLTDAAN